MAGRPQGVRSFTNNNAADTLIMTGTGNLYSVSLSWTGLTVGDRITLHDNTAASGTKIFEFIVPTAAGSYSPHLPSVGLVFGTGLFYNPNVSASTVLVEIGYDGV